MKKPVDPQLLQGKAKKCVVCGQLTNTKHRIGGMLTEDVFVMGWPNPGSWGLLEKGSVVCLIHPMEKA